MNPKTILDIVRGLLDLVLSLVPKTVAVQMLDEAAIARQNAIADAAEAAKFGLLPSLADEDDDGEVTK